MEKVGPRVFVGEGAIAVSSGIGAHDQAAIPNDVVRAGRKQRGGLSVDKSPWMGVLRPMVLESPGLGCHFNASRVEGESVPGFSVIN